MLPDIPKLRLDTARAIMQISRPPKKSFAGRGIVICAGGPTYFVQAYVNIRLLRELGCRLPIQVWHRDASEMTPRMRKLLAPLQVECVNAQDIARNLKKSQLPGWTIKPFAILNSKFEEVLYLDSDSLPVRDPEYLFRDPSYQRTGSLFWTDRFRGKSSAYSTVHPGAWSALNVPFREEPECESGQLLVNKRLVWKELNLCLYFNEEASSFYRFVYGDKDTFRFAWHRLGREFNTVPFGPSSPPNFRVLYQLDPYGSVVFQHRARAKWQVKDANVPIAGFQHEAKCLSFIDELKSDWDKVITQWRAAGPKKVLAARDKLAKTAKYACALNGKFLGLVKFYPDGRLASQLKQLPSHWQVLEQPDGSVSLGLMGDRAAPILMRGQQSCWFGERVAGKRESICLAPIEVAKQMIRKGSLHQSQSVVTTSPISVQLPGELHDRSLSFECDLLASGNDSSSQLLLNIKPEDSPQNFTVETFETSELQVDLEAIGHDSSGVNLQRVQAAFPSNPNISTIGAWSGADVEDPTLDGSWSGTDIEDPTLDGSWSGTDVVDPILDGSWSGTDVEDPILDGSWSGTDVEDPILDGSWSGTEVEDPILEGSWSGTEVEDPILNGGWSGTDVEDPILNGGWSGTDVEDPILNGGWSGTDVEDPILNGGWSGTDVEDPILNGGWSGTDVEDPILNNGSNSNKKKGNTSNHAKQPGKKKGPVRPLMPGRFVKVYGMPRTCTNVVSHLLKQNFTARVFSNELGWKHGPNLYREGDTIQGHPLRFVICVRHPYSWLVSFYRFEVQGQHFTSSFPAFVRGGCKTYRRHNPIERYNLLVRMWLGIAKNPEIAQVVRAESIQKNQLGTMQTLEKQFSLQRKKARLTGEQRQVGPDEQMRQRSFDAGYYKDHRFLANYDQNLLDFVNERIDQELMELLEYKLLDCIPNSKEKS